MAQISPIARLGQVFEEGGFIAVVEEADGNAVGRIGINLGSDDRDCPYILQIHFLNDLAERAGIAPDADEAVILQFLLVFPFEAPATRIADILRLNALLNRYLPVGALGYDEDEGKLYLSFNLLAESRVVPAKVAVEAASMLDHAVREYKAEIEAVASGALSFDALRDLYASIGKLAERRRP